MLGTMYRMNHARVVDVVTANDADTTVPACPAWTATDVIRHLAGLATDVLAGNVAEYGTDPWTAAQIEARSEHGLDQLLEEWSGAVDPLADLMDGESLGILSQAIIGDLLHHEFDLRNAFGDRSERDRPDVAASAIGHVKSLRRGFTALGKPTLRVFVDGNPIDIGREEPVATVAMTSFETVRAIGGRRTLDEIRQYEWTGDPEQFLDAFVTYPLSAPDSSLGEQ